ncbi:MAG TPA: hypothetical protein PK397_12315 [Ignavibacteriaceae bacterium]|nr:hypothetical protein [Ignavibacteriaceae bacterium]
MYRLVKLTFIFSIIIIAASMNAHTSKVDKFSNINEKLIKELTAKYGETQKERLIRGLQQTSALWLPEDGDESIYEDFVRTHFAGTNEMLDAMFNRYQRIIEQVFGNMLEISLSLRWHTDLDLGQIYPFDEIFASYDPSAHLADDMFKNKLAFVLLLNFPIKSLTDCMKEGEKWSRREWAEMRLARLFDTRIPADVNMAIAKAAAESDQYIAEYNIWMHHLLNEKGERLFPPKMKLLSHWNLRDEIKGNYANEENGLEKQKMIMKVMERIVTQTIPAMVINNPQVDWNPFTNEVTRSTVIDYDPPVLADFTPGNSPEPDTRYKILLNTFLASKLADPYSPSEPTLIARRFNEGRQIPEERIKEILTQVVASPLVADVAKLIEKRLGRKLHPFDIWYNGFRVKSKYSEAELDKIVSEKYPDAEAFKKDMPNLLIKLGFSKEKAEYLADNIEVDPARGSGHAWGAAMKSGKARLRTRIGQEGMNYKGFNIAIHEFGHNVEQTFSLKNIDHYMLQGVPNTAFTEAIAFVFQGQDLKLLDLEVSDPEADALKALNSFWATYEISGVSLVDMEVWHWMYDNPDATPAQLKEAVLSISKEIWNKYYAPVFGVKDVVLLGIYSHMIHSFLYLPDYPVGHLIAHQIEEHLKSVKNFGEEIERITTLGNILPDIWMKSATGSTVGADALIESAKKAYEKLK